MKFSIIIATLNNQDTIEKNLKSIKDQNYKDYEIIVIDGESKDKTIEIIKKFKFQNIKIKFQKGKGVYNAFNEGIKHSIGEIIIILNADDYFYKKYALSKISKEFELNENLDLLMSNVKMVNNKNKIIRVYKNDLFRNFMFYLGYMPPHPGIFLKKEIYNKFGYFLENLENAGDFEFLLRVIYKKKIKYKKISDFLVHMNYGGKSNKNIYSFVTNTIEIKKALKLNNYYSSYLLIMFRFIIKLFQFRI